MMNLLWIGGFGLAGIFSRYGLDLYLQNRVQDFPLSTFLINVVGAFCAGLIYTLYERQEISTVLQLGLLVGFCGGFTTFSAFSLQTFQMIDKEKLGMAFAYLFLSPLLGLLAASIPILISRRLA